MATDQQRQHDGGDDPYGVVAAFPHSPYSIQRDFMVALYETLEAGQIGLFESPTGERWGGVQAERRNDRALRAVLCCAALCCVLVLRGCCTRSTPRAINRIHRHRKDAEHHLRDAQVARGPAARGGGAQGAGEAG